MNLTFCGKAHKSTYNFCFSKFFVQKKFAGNKIVARKHSIIA